MMDVPCCTYFTMMHVVGYHSCSMCPAFFVSIESNFVILVLGIRVVCNFETEVLK